MLISILRIFHIFIQNTFKHFIRLFSMLKTDIFCTHLCKVNAAYISYTIYKIYTSGHSLYA